MIYTLIMQFNLEVKFKDKGKKGGTRSFYLTSHILR